MRRCSCLLLAVLLLTGVAPAQTSTGRHRVDRAQDEEPLVADFDDAGGSWCFQAAAGAMAAGDLLQVRTGGLASIPFDPPGGNPFNSDAFTLTLDESIGVSLAVGRRITDSIWLRAAVGLGQLDVAARARVGQTAEVYRWDQVAVVTAGLDAEARLVRHPSYFYLLAGVGVVNVAGDAGDQLDSTSAVLRFGAGYHQRLAPGWGLRLEVRDSLAALDLADATIPVAGDGVSPDLRVTDAGTDHVWELLAGLQTTF